LVRVRIDVSEESIASGIRLERISKLCGLKEKLNRQQAKYQIGFLIDHGVRCPISTSRNAKLFF
jgi:hypothetical protein